METVREIAKKIKIVLHLNEERYIYFRNGGIVVPALEQDVIMREIKARYLQFHGVRLRKSLASLMKFM